MKDGRHLPLLYGIVKWAAKTLEANEHFIRQMVHEKAGKVLRWTGLDENLADAIIGGLHKLLGEMAENPAHPLRAKAEEGLEKLAADIQFDVGMQPQIGRASGRERVGQEVSVQVAAVSIIKKHIKKTAKQETPPKNKIN